jgi:peptidoglycan/LPS O-acetylase OafA/YrhL
LPYRPALDGLRALAVLAVLLYHLSPATLPGGLLGVDLFFVLSGYLITGLLLAEWAAGGRIDLARFWLRRARRLLPAVYVLLAALLAVAVLRLPDEAVRLRGDAAAAFVYVMNWHQIVGEQSYFAAIGRPSLFQHLWSLAIEEQFYLVWPLLLLVLLRWGRRLLLPVAIAGTIASTIWMAHLYHAGSDPSRVYYGTDTRAAALLVGALLAALGFPRWWPAGSSRGGRLLLDGLGLVALAALVACARWLDPATPLLYRGGFLVVSLTAALLIAAVLQPGARLLPWLLAQRPLVAVGKRSYGLYLWHWPVIVLTRPGLDVPLHGPALLGLRLGMMALLTELSYRLVEQPVRSGQLWARWRRLLSADTGLRLHRQAGVGVLLGATAGGLGVVGVALVQARPPAPPAGLAVASIHTTPPPMPAAAAALASAAAPREVAASPVGTVAAADNNDVVTASPSPTAVAVRARAPLPPPRLRVSAIGDSVLLGAAGPLTQTLGQMVIDAEIGLQPGAGLAMLQQRSAAGQLGDVVIVHLGNNGPFTAAQFDQMMQVLARVPRVLVVNVTVPRPWEDANNAMMANSVKHYANAMLVDWHAASTDHPEYFISDGVHLDSDGMRAYTDLLGVRVEAVRIVAWLEDV